MDIKTIFQDLNKKGFPIPLIRYKGEGSLSATTFWIATTAVLVGFGINIAAYICATFYSCGTPHYFSMTELLTWFGVTSVPYIARRGSEDSSGSTTKSSN